MEDRNHVVVSGVNQSRMELSIPGQMNAIIEEKRGMRVFLYARVSTGKEADRELSIPDQLKTLHNWCSSGGHEVVGEYVDCGLTGTDDRRPDFQRMMKDACASSAPCDAITVHSLSRFYLDQFELGLHERQLNRHKVQLISITKLTTDDAVGEMQRKFLSLFDEYQSKEHAKHTLRAMKENARQGFFNGSHIPFGFCLHEEMLGNIVAKKRIIEDKEEAEVVRGIFKRYLQSRSLKSIATALNEEGVLRRGKPWSARSISLMLRSEIYVGKAYFNRKCRKTGEVKPEDEWILLTVPQIVDVETFDFVQGALGNRKLSS